MFNELLNSLTGDLTSKLNGTKGLDSDKIGSVANVVTDTFKNGLTDKLKGGQLGDIMSLLGKSGSTSSFATTLISNTVSNLISKLGLPESVSKTISNVAVPFVIEKFGNFVSSKGKNSEEGITELLGDLVKGSVAKDLLGGLGKKLGF